MRQLTLHIYGMCVVLQSMTMLARECSYLILLPRAGIVAVQLEAISHGSRLR